MNIYFRAKKLVPLGFKTRCLYGLSRAEPSQYENLRGKRKAIVALAADYPNLGDIAITFAQTRFLKACLPDFEIVDFPSASTFTDLKALKHVCTPDDLVTIVGGGNMGDLYQSIEDARRFLIGHFPKNRIISFPQTIDFSETSHGQRENKRSGRVYRRHRNLHLFAREPVSYETMRSDFPGKPTHLVPDIVLSLQLTSTVEQRKGVLLCIRNDKESAIGPAARENLIDRIVSRVSDIRITDTVLPRSGRLTLADREHELTVLLDAFSQTEVVITDRLHGMIFAAITRTPCVVMPNSNHKIAATFRTWLFGLPHIVLVNDYAEKSVIEALNEVRSYASTINKMPKLADSFLPLRKAICEIL